MAEIDGLVSHRTQDVAGQGWVVGLGGQLDGYREVLLCGRVLGIVERHPATEVRELAGSGEQAAANVSAGVGGSERAGDIGGQVLHHRGARMPAAAALI